MFYYCFVLLDNSLLNLLYVELSVNVPDQARVGLFYKTKILIMAKNLV